MRSTILLLMATFLATTAPVSAQPLTKPECDDVVRDIAEISRAAAGMLVHVENMNVAALKVGGDKGIVAVERLEHARKELIPTLSEFALAAKDVGQVVAAMCPR